MVDLTKCTNTDCPSRKLCYRCWAADRKIWQSYALFKPDYATGKCEYYLPKFRVIAKRKQPDVKS